MKFVFLPDEEEEQGGETLVSEIIKHASLNPQEEAVGKKLILLDISDLEALARASSPDKEIDVNASIDQLVGWLAVQKMDILIVVNSVSEDQMDIFLKNVSNSFRKKRIKTEIAYDGPPNGIAIRRLNIIRFPEKKSGIKKSASQKKEKGLKKLSSKENQIMELLAAGMDTHSIAGELFISYTTVRKHIQNIYTKLEVNSRVKSIMLWKEVSKNKSNG